MDHIGRVLDPAATDLTPDQVDIPCRNSVLCRALAEPGSWQNCGPWSTHTGALLARRTAAHGQDPRWNWSWKTAVYGKGSCWSRRKVWGGNSSRRELLYADHNPPISHLTVLLGGGGNRGTMNEGGKLSLWKRGGDRVMVF